MSRVMLFVVLGVALCGCDGHIRSFKPLPAAGRTGMESSVQRQKLVEAVAAVAAERGYTRAEPKPESELYTVVVGFSKPAEHGSVQMKLVRDTKTGAYRVVLIDWPSFVRSSESVAAEAAMREKLNAY